MNEICKINIKSINENELNESFQSILIDAFLVDILKYLSIKELARIRRVSKLFQRLIDKEATIIFEKINIYIFDELINLDWLLNIVMKNKIKILNLLLCDNVSYIRKIVNSADPNSLEELKVPTNFFLGTYDLIKFINLKSLTVKNMYFNEGGLDQDIHMISNLVNLPWITNLKLNNIKFVKAIFFQFLNNKFEKLDFTESADFRIEDMREFIIKQSEFLKILRLDGEHSNENVLSDCVIKLNNLTELYIGYCENFNSQILLIIANNLRNLTKLTLRKLRIESMTIENFFQIFNMDNLVKLDFYDCHNLNNMCAFLISEKATNLEFLDISWSTEIKNEAIINLFKNCKNIKILNVQGCKLLNEQIFDDFLIDENNNKKYLNFLKQIDFSKCDLLHDIILNKVMKRYPHLAIINYYGMNLKYEV